LQDTARLLPQHVVEALVGEAFSRLDAGAQQVMHALAIYGRPVTPAALDYLLQPHAPGVNSAPVLSRLVNMQFARKEAGHYYLHPVDRAYACTRVPVGDKADREAKIPPYTQFSMLHRGAEYFKQARTPRKNWKSIEDLAPQLAEFDLRCEGQDYDTAAHVLFSIDQAHLVVWGHYQLTVELHDRLQGRLTHLHEREISLGRLGLAYRRLGKYQKAVICYEQALTCARERNDRWNEGVWLGSLGICLEGIGQTAHAIECHEQSLAISQEAKSLQGEGCDLGNLGYCYGNLGQTSRSLDYYYQALTLSRKVRDRESEGCYLANIANVLIDEGRYREAIEQAIEARRIANEVKSSYVGCYSNVNLALSHLYCGDLSSARGTTEVARQYNEPEDNHFVVALMGVIALRQGNAVTAQGAFAEAISETDELLGFTVQNYFALDTKGLALCGLTLCDGVNRTAAASEAYRAARVINRDAGIIARVLRLFDALAVVDAAGVLQAVRAEAAGE
jgi:tetratricopeptide (TPR) repeat protein